MHDAVNTVKRGLTVDNESHYLHAQSQSQNVSIKTKLRLCLQHEPLIYAQMAYTLESINFLLGVHRM